MKISSYKSINENKLSILWILDFNLLRIPRQSDRKAVSHALERVELVDLRDNPISKVKKFRDKIVLAAS